MTNHPLIQAVLQVGIVAGSLTAIIILTERIWGPMRRWLANALTNPIVEKLDEVEQKIESHVDYVQHHLGPNGTTTPIHVRLGVVEEYIRREEARRTRLEGEPD